MRGVLHRKIDTFNCLPQNLIRYKSRNNPEKI